MNIEIDNHNREMKELEDVTILVNSCDKYEDAWEPFFKLWSIQWYNCPYKIILNTETKEFVCDYLKVESFCSGKGLWTQRLKNALSYIDTEFVLFTLEDFFLMSPVNTSAWEKALKEMKKNQEIGFLWFPANGIFQPKDYQKELAPFFYLTKAKSCNRVNALIGLWRKEFLLQMLFRDGDAWYWEWSAVKLSKYSDFKVAFWDQRQCPIFSYEVNPEAGYGIVRGKWLKNNKILFEKYDIDVDYSKLGYLNEDVTYESLGLVQVESKHRIIKKFNRLVKRIKGHINETKRAIKVYPAFKKYCREIKSGR